MQNTHKRNIYLSSFSNIFGKGFGKNISMSFILFFGMASISYAEPHSGGHDKKMNSGHHQKSSGHHAKKSKMGSTFSSHWAKTISDEQKISFDKMHLEVAQFEAVHRAKMKMLKAELGVLTAKQSHNKTAIYAKIDEILAVKKDILRNRFDHIVEMRDELNEQQRISYDMGILKRGKHKH